jgi:hypothetical protein
MSAGVVGLVMAIGAGFSLAWATGEPWYGAALFNTLGALRFILEEVLLPNPGWLCTRCGKSNAPSVLACDCVPVKADLTPKATLTGVRDEFLRRHGLTS